MNKLLTLCVVLAALSACPDEKNCMACTSRDNKSVCAYCYLGWVDANGKCVILPIKDRLDHCNLYNLQEKDKPVTCAVCQPGFFLENGKCLACKLNGCAKCTKENDCRACLNGKKLQLVPEVKCLDQPADVANCEVCDYVSPARGCRCDLCKSGFVYNPNLSEDKSCVEDKVGNCYVLDRANDQRCAYCAFGYYIGVDGKCWNNNRQAWGWALWILLALVVIAIPLIWFCYRKKHRDDTLPYSQRLVN